MPDTGTKRKSRAGSREDGADDDDGTGDKNVLAEIQAWLDTVPLISVAPPKQVRRYRCDDFGSIRTRTEKEEQGELFFF